MADLGITNLPGTLHDYGVPWLSTIIVAKDVFWTTDGHKYKPV